MRKLLILTLALLVLSSVASATLTRTLTLGHSNNILKDDGNIWLYPSTMFDYPDMAIGEFECVDQMMVGKKPLPIGKIQENDFVKLGIHYKFGEDNPSVIGMYFSTEQPYPDFPWWMTSMYWRGMPNNHRIDLFYARKLGENKFGAHFKYLQGSDKYEYDDVNDPDTNLTEFGTSGYFFNLGLTMMEDKLDLAAGITFLSWTDIYSNGYDRTEPDGNILFHVRGRYWHEMNQKITIIPHAEINYEKFGTKRHMWYSDSYVDTIKVKVSSQNEEKTIVFNLGFGMNYTPSAKILAIGDIGIAFNKETIKNKDWEYSHDSLILDNEYKRSYTYLPYIKIGLEGEVFKWLDVRLGATTYWQKYSREDNYGQGGLNDSAYKQKYSTNMPYNSSYIGLGFHWGNFYIDTYMDPALLIDGFEFIRGNNHYKEEYWYYQDRRMNYNVTLRYDML